MNKISDAIGNWFYNNFGWVCFGLIAALLGLMVLSAVAKEKYVQSMVGKTKDQVIQELGSPSSIMPIAGGEVDTWATEHAPSTTYVYSGGRGGGVAIPITTGPTTERTAITFINNVATRVSHTE